MFEHFTEPAQRVVMAARTEALSLGHDEIDTPHLLLGLLTLEQEPVVEVLARNGVTAERARSWSRELPAGEAASDRPQFTVAAKAALERSMREAIARHRSRTIDPADMLMALLGERAGMVTSMVIGFGADPSKIRAELGDVVR